MILYKKTNYYKLTVGGVKMLTKLNEKSLVVKDNKLIEARYRLTLNEQKVIYAIISTINPELEKGNIKCTFDLNQLSEFCNINKKNASRDIQEVTRLLKSRVLSIKNGKSTLQIGWINYAEYKDGIVEFEIHEKLKPYLCGLKSAFTSIDTMELMSFKSSYTGRIYELVYQYRKIGSRTISLEDLKDYLGLDGKEYALFGHIKARIIVPALKEINKNTKYNISCDYIKTGRKITDLEFHISEKNKTYEEILEEKGQTNIISAIEIAEGETSAIKEPPKRSKMPLENDLSKYLKKDILKGFLNEYGQEYCEIQLEYSLKHATDNIGGYLVNAIKNDYAGFEKVKESKKDKEIALQKAEKLQEEQERLLQEQFNFEGSTTNNFLKEYNARKSNK